MMSQVPKPSTPLTAANTAMSASVERNLKPQAGDPDDSQSDPEYARFADADFSKAKPVAGIPALKRLQEAAQSK